MLMHHETGNGDAELKKWIIIAAVSALLLAAAMCLLIFCTKSEPKPIMEQPEIVETAAAEEIVPAWHIETAKYSISEDAIVCGTELFSAPDRAVLDEILLAAKNDGKLQSTEELSSVSLKRGTVKLKSYFDEDCYLTDTEVEKAINDAVMTHIKDSTRGMPEITMVSITGESNGTTRCYTLDYSEAPTVSAAAVRRDENGVTVRTASCVWALDEEIDSETANKLVKYVRDSFATAIEGEGAVLHVSLSWKGFVYERNIVCTEENEETVNAVAAFIIQQAHRHDAEAANIGFMTKEGRVK